MLDALDVIPAGYDGDVGALLAARGRILKAWLNQDSDCRSWAVDVDGRRWFVKHSDVPRGVASLQRAVAVNRAVAAGRAVQHETLPALRQVVETAHGGLALVYDWVPGECLYHGSAARRAASGPLAFDRFMALPLAERLAAADALLDLHVALVEAGFVAVDLYDGCFVYDFEGHRLSMCDLDEYRPGPFVLEADRLPGSRRYMAPEEFKRGATIDQRTTVFNLGRAAQELVGGGSLAPEAWGACEALREIVIKAVAPDPQDRWSSVAELARQWAEMSPAR